MSDGDRLVMNFRAEPGIKEAPGQALNPDDHIMMGRKRHCYR
jgi:hypothetical protein